MEVGEEDETSKREPGSKSPLPEPGVSTVMNAESVSGSQCELQTEPPRGGVSGESPSRDEKEHQELAVGDSGVRTEEEGGEKVSEERGTVGGEVFQEGNVAEGSGLDIAGGETDAKPVVVAENAMELDKASDLIVSETEMLPRDGGNDGGGLIGEKARDGVQLRENSGVLDAGIDVVEKEGEKGVAANMAPSVGNTMVEDVEEAEVEGGKKEKAEGNEVPADMAVAEDVRHSECDGGDTMVEEVKEADLEGAKKVEEGSEVPAHMAEDVRHSECESGDTVVEEVEEAEAEAAKKVREEGSEVPARKAEDVRHSECDGGDTVVEEVKEAEAEGAQKVKEEGSEVPDSVAQGVKDSDDRMVEDEMKGGVEDKATENMGISSGIEDDAEVVENAAKKEKEIQEESREDTAAGTRVEDTMDTVTDAEYREVEDEQDDTEVMEEKVIPEEMNVGEDTDLVEEMEIAEDIDVGDEEKMEEGSKSGGTKRRRRRIPRAVKKNMEEDVCFICFDGGELVLCDRRGCPKAYHPSCVNRDEAFFRTKGKWNCGWHICSSCQKTAHYFCLTCTFSLCKACTKGGIILCVRGNKGFCQACMRTIMMIENNGPGPENKDMGNVDFDDRSSWEFLFKDYYIDLKEQMSLTTEEVVQAKCPWKESDMHTGKQESRADVDDEGGSDSDNSFGSPKASLPKRRQNRKRSRSDAKDNDPPKRSTLVEARKVSRDNDSEWASKELLEFVMHMKNGDKSVLSQFDVQALLLEYIKTNKLRDPRRKSQIICDARLQSLFGKPRVGHFEMLKLLESHFLIKEDADDLQGSVVDSDANQLDADGNFDASGKSSKDRKRKMRKKGDDRGFQSNVGDYAAIDNHNIGLLYLRRNLMEDLLEDSGTFPDKVVGSFVRIRISGSNQKQDLYRLVPVTGTSQAMEPYKVGKRTTNFLLEILNLDKTEVVSIDVISNQDFMEDECKRLRQSIKCGLINRLTVGEIQEKAAELQLVRVKDWLETETAKLSHLRDRASDLGRRKELRECVEKLQLLKMPEERQRRLEEIPEIHADPKMDPGYESDDNEADRDDKRRGAAENNVSSRTSGFSGRVREPISPQKGSVALNDSWGGSRTPSTPHRELSRNLSNKRLSMRDTDLTGGSEIINESSWSHGVKEEMQHPSSWEKQKLSSNSEITLRSSNSGLASESMSRVDPEIRPTAIGTAQSVAKINETEKMWHYKDPSGKVQGPFSLVQLRKWNTTGYFPADLRIWKTTEKQDDSVLLTDALNGKLLKDTPRVDVRAQMFSPHHTQQGLESQGVMQSNQSRGTQGLHPEEPPSMGRAKPAPVEVSQLPSDRWGASTNLPSPTPAQTMSGGMRGHADENKWPSGSVPNTNPFPGGSGGAQPLSLMNPESGNVSQLASSINVHHLHSQSAVPGDSHRVQGDTRFPLASDVSKISGVAAMQNIGPALQQLVQAVVNQNPAAGTAGWGSAQKTEVILKSEPSSISVQPSTHGQWGEVPSSVNSSTFNTANLGAFVNPWRPSGSGDQSNVQSSSFNAWGSGNSNNIAAAPTPSLDNRGTGWVQMPGNPAVGWGPVSGNTNVNWVAPGSANPSWATPGQVQAPVNPLPGWAPSGQGTVHGNVNTGFVTPGQAPVPNASASWPDSVNQRAWATEQNQNGDRHSGQRDRGLGGGDSGYGGGKAWNRQSSFGSGGGGSSRSSSKDRGICNYYQRNGFCKKGASCNFRHI